MNLKKHMKKILSIIFAITTIVSFAQAPSNDVCTNALAVVIPSTGSICFNSSNTNATSDGFVNACDNGAAGNEVWFTYVATGANNTITVTPNGTNPATSVVVTVISTGCASGTYDVCGSASGAGAATASVGLAPGTQVLVSVETNGGDGDFEVCISSLPPDASPGNTCAQATQICDKSTINLPDLTGFTASGTIPGCFVAAVRKDVWIKFTVGVTGTLEFVGNPVAADEFDWALYDITSGCPGTLVECDYNYASGGPFSCGTPGANFGMLADPSAQACPGEFEPVVTVTAGQTYALLIDNFSQTNDGFSLTWGGTFEMGLSSLFTVTPQSSCAVPLTVNITNSSVGATSYAWNFGDGSTSTSASPGTHTYTSTGDYLISLVASDGTCTDVYSQRVNLNTGPVISITPTSATVCAGSSASLTAGIALGTPYNEYSFTNGTNQTITNNSTTGINSNVTSSGLLNTTLGTGMLQSICFTINHSAHDDIGRGPIADAVQITVNGNSYNFTPLPLPAASGTATYCFPQSVLNAIMAAGGNSNTTWTFHIEDNRGGGGGTGDLTSWTVVLRDVNSISSYSWSPTTNMSNPTTLTPTVTPTVTTTYTLTAQDVFGCTSQETVQVTVNPGSVSGSGPTSATYCVGDIVPSGALTSTPGGATFAWTNTNTDIGLAASGTGTPIPSFTAANTTGSAITGVISVVPTLGGCSGSAYTYTITIDANPTVTGTLSACVNGTSQLTGSATAHATTPWASSNTGVATVNSTGLVTAVSAGTSTITYMNTNGCTVTATFTVNANPTIVVSGTNAICNGGTTSLSAIGALTYTWSPTGSLSSSSGTPVTATPTVSTVYTISGTDANSCSSSVTYSVTVNDNPTAINYVVGPASCGASDGTVTISGTVGGTANYQYNFNNLGLSATTSFTSLASGSYPLLVSDQNGCTFSTLVNISSAGGPTAVASTLVADSCGRNTGEIAIGLVTGGGGTNVFSVDGSVFSATTNYTGLSSGLHSITIRDQNNCTFSTSVTIPALVGPTGFSTNNIDETCGSTNGSVEVVTVNGGTSAYTYSINGGTFGASTTFTGLVSGTYTITVKDANTCEFTNQVSITNIAGPTAIDSLIVDATCGASNGSITLGLVTGGVGADEFNINGGAFGAANSFSGLVAATYTIGVRDDNGCTYTTQITVGNSGGPSAITATITNATCGLSNGSITIDNVTGGAGSYQYSLDGVTYSSTNTFTNLSATNYTIYVQDGNLCGYSEPFVITQTAGPTDIDSVVVNATCDAANGSVDITAVNGGVVNYQYNFNNLGLSTTTLYSGLIAGTYPLIVVDGNNCNYNTTITIGGTPAITAITSNVINEACGQLNGSINITAVTGGTSTYQYSINGGALGASSSFTGLSVGSYTIGIEDAAGCTYSEVVLVAGTSGPSAVSSTVTDAGCSVATGSIVINSVTGGSPSYSYGINGGTVGASNTFTGLGANTYTIEVVDANLCTYTTTLTVNTLGGPTSATTSQVNTTCGNANGSITVDAVVGGTSPYQYSINGGGFGPGNSFASLTASTTYTISLVDANNCPLTLPAIVLNDIAGPSAATTSQTDAACGNSNGSITVDAVTGGTAPYNYNINGGVFVTTNSFTSLNSGQAYTISIVDANNCSYILAPITLNDIAGPSSAITSQVNTTCGNANGSITIDPSSVVGGVAPYSYSINGGALGTSNVFTNLSSASSHTITVSDANGCSVVLPSVVLTDMAGPTAIASTVVDVTCGAANGSFTVDNVTGGTAPYLYDLNNLGFGIVNTLGNLNIGSYPVSIQDANGCVFSTSIVIAGSTAVVADFTSTPTSGITPVTVDFNNNSTVGVTYSWTFGNGSSASTYDAQQQYTTAGVYNVTLIVSNGNVLCNDTATAIITVMGEPTVTVPNIFSPNGDGINDALTIQSSGFKELNISIFNRWGTLITSYNAIGGSWNGDNNSEGTYFYILTGKRIDDKEFESHGTIMLVK